MSQTSSLRQLAAQRAEGGVVLGRAAGDQDGLRARPDVFERNRDRALLQFGVDGRARRRRRTGRRSRPPRRGEMSSSSIRVSRKLPSNSVVEVDTAPTPNSITSARLPASSVREINESLRIETTVDGSAYSGAGSRIVVARSTSAQRPRMNSVPVWYAAVDMAPSSWTTVRQLATPGDSAVGHRDLLGAPGESEDVAGRQPAHQQRGGGTAHAGECGGPARGADVDAVARRPRLRSGRSAARVRAPRRRAGRHCMSGGTTTSMRTSPLALARATSRPAVGPGDAEPGRDLGLGEAVEVVERRGAQREPQVFGGGCAVSRRRHGLASDRPGDLAVRRRYGHGSRPVSCSTCEHLLRGASRCSSR